MVFDLGKTRCRAALWRDGHPVTMVAGPGAPGLAEHGGLRAAAHAICSLVPRLRESMQHGPDLVSVGAAGAAAAPAEAAKLAELLHGQLSVRQAAVTSDVVTAHAGALGGDPGVVLVAGTGVAAVGISHRGRCEFVDGWGQWLGDDGGGGWVGRAGLRAVLRARDGRGPSTGLTRFAERRYGEVNRLPATLASSGNTVAATAAFGADVALCAASGDAAAQAVIEEAAERLAETTVAAAAIVNNDDRDRSDGSHGTVPVVFSGGLSHWGAVLLGSWRTAVEQAAQRVHVTVEVLEPRGTPLDGAALLAAPTQLPHESQVLRFPPGAEEHQ